MPEYIERERYCDYLKSRQQGFIANPDDLTDGWCSGMADAREIAANFPAAQVTRIPQWISVADRLPENEEEVIALIDRHAYQEVVLAIYEDGTAQVEKSVWTWPQLDEDIFFFVPCGWWENRLFQPAGYCGEKIRSELVTHWMPLPKPPKSTK